MNMFNFIVVFLFWVIVWGSIFIPELFRDWLHEQPRYPIKRRLIFALIVAITTATAAAIWLPDFRIFLP